MTPQRLWPVVLVALFIMPIQSLRCVYLDSATLKSVRLLGSIIQSPLKCLKDIQDFAFPKEILPHIQHVERDLKEVFYLASIQALNIFSQNRYFSPVLRERLEHIGMALFEQMWQAQDCFMDENNEDSMIERPLPMYLQRVYLELNKYFIKIKKFLWVKKYSLCAWKIVAAEMRRCFMIFYNFKKLLKIKSGAQEGSNKIFLPINRPEMEDNDNPESKKSIDSLTHCGGGDELAHTYYGQYCNPQQPKKCTSPAMSPETYSRE